MNSYTIRNIILLYWSYCWKTSVEIELWYYYLLFSFKHMSLNLWHWCLKIKENLTMKQIQHWSKITDEHHKYFLWNPWQIVLQIFINKLQIKCNTWKEAPSHSLTLMHLYFMEFFYSFALKNAVPFLMKW